MNYDHSIEITHYDSDGEIVSVSLKKGERPDDLGITLMLAMECGQVVRPILRLADAIANYPDRDPVDGEPLEALYDAAHNFIEFWRSHDEQA